MRMKEKKSGDTRCMRQLLLLTWAVELAAEVCLAGRYLSGASGCVSCATGTWNVAGAPSCNLCARNFFGANVSTGGIATCLPCEANFFSLPGSLACCQAGYWSAAKGASCVICPAGAYCYYGPPPTLCDAGRYNPDMGKANDYDCAACPAGKSTDNPAKGQTSCTNCGAFPLARPA